MDAPISFHSSPDVIEQREIIKLIKNSKGYNWEIKVIITNQASLTVCENDEFALSRLKKINEDLMTTYG